MLLSVQDLAIDLKRGADRHQLVSNASWELDRGETLAIVGESGSGKSLTALAVMGLLADELVPVNGKIIFDGQDLLQSTDDYKRARRGADIAMVFQEPMTSHQLSGGMRQRIMIAIALACKPKLILADEPTTALDVTIQAQILSLMSTLCSDNDVGLVLITHNLGIVARHAQRVVVMYGGRVVEQAAAKELYRSPRHPYTQGLMRSVPRMDSDRNEPLQPISGAPPDPFDVIEGCRFNPRCANATDKCRTTVPVMKNDSEHWVACWNWQQLS